MKLPAPVDNVVGDLRERRLLSVVAVLVLALIAVPVLLGSGGEPPAPAPQTAALEEALSAPEAQPVVLAEAPAIRKYRERLARFTKRNPFRQQLSGMPGGAEEDLFEDQGPAGGGSGGEPVDPAPGPGPGPGDSGSGGGGDSGPAPEAPAPKVIDKEKIMLFWHEIDVKVGHPGSSRKRKGIKPGQLLPSKKVPAALFLEASSSSGQASFYISRDVAGTHGGGECAPDPDNCEYLLLEEGDEQRFRWGPNGRIYRLKLAKVHLKSKIVDIDKLEKEELAAMVEGRTRFSGLIDALRR